MRERGIHFNREMVRAVMEGRKVQTRRIIKEQRIGDSWSVRPTDVSKYERHTHDWWLPNATLPYSPLICPFGAVGDRLWVRETWAVVSHAFDDDGLMINYVPDRPAKAVHEKPFGKGYYSGHTIYAADGGFTWGDDDGCVDGRSCWKSSIHMPRWASRITLEITGVRVERLQDISESDATAEGCDNSQSRAAIEMGWYEKPRKAFWRLWKTMYGEESWQANPWVWVIEFRKLEVTHD